MAANLIVAAIGAIAIGLLVRGQHISARRARQQAAQPVIPQQRKGEQ